jgi:hypothetical protein
VIYEYALDPQTVASWHRQAEYTFFAGEFGLGSPRAMSAYPRFGLWRRDVIRAAKATGAADMDWGRITALLGVLQANKIERGDAPFDGARTWLENAEDEHGRTTFHAIMALDNPRGRPFVIPGSMTGVIAHPLWACIRNDNRPRRSVHMCNCVRNMLRLARTVAFVDPHFHPGSPRYQSSMAEFLKTLVVNRATPAGRIEIHTALDTPGSAFVGVFQREMPALTPSGITVRLRRWAQKPGGEKLHDRFILTNLGGAKFSVGLDEGDHGETTDIDLLNSAQYELRWSQYMGTPPAFDSPEPPTDVVGTRVL